MSDTGSYKLRALFLAAVMVTSVFAGVAGTASAETLDTDDGVSDLRNSTELGGAPDITLSNSSTPNDILINGSSDTNVTFGYNTTDVSNRTANFTVTNISGSGFTSIGNNVSALTNGAAQNGTFNITNGTSGLIPNGETYELNATLFNTSSNSQIAGSTNVTIETFAIDADNTTDQNFVAQRTVEVADLNVNASSPESVTVNLNGTNAANLTSDEISSVTVTEVYNDGSTFDNTANSVTDVEDIDATLQDPANLSQLRVAATSSSSLDSNVVLDANVSFFTQDGQNGLTTTVDTLGNQSAVSGANAASIQGTVQSTSSSDNPVDGATVTVTNVDTNSFVTNLTTDSNGDYVGNLGGNANYSVEVTDDDEIVLNNYIQRDSDTQFDEGDGYIPTGRTGTIDITLDETLVATTLNITNVEPSSQSVVADNSTLINVTAEVNDQDGNPLNGVSVSASTPSNTVFFSGSSTKTTGQGTQTGNVTFRVFSNESQTIDLQLSAGSTDALDKNATLTFTPTFRDAEEGAIVGDVRRNSGEPVEDAQVHAFAATRVSSNQLDVNYNFSDSPTNSTASFRLVNLSSDEVVDSDEYEVTFSDSDVDGNFTFPGGSDDTRPLNSSDSTVGTGFQVVNQSTNTGNTEVNVTITSLQTGNFTVEVADTDAPSNSVFSNVSEVQPLASNSFQPSANLTYADAESRSTNSGQNLADVTDADGEYDLTQLFTAGNDGFDYYVVIQQPGLSTEVEGPITVDPDNSPFTQGTTILKPRDAPPVDTVNITNLGLADSDGGDITQPFDNTTDDFAQEVPRDGTYDVVEVETTVSATGAVGNGTVTLEVPDDSNVDAAGTQSSAPAQAFTGDFTSVDNGTLLSSGEDNVTIATGDNGVARVYLETDSATVDLNESTFTDSTTRTGITGALSGSSSTDFTNKSFVGVTSFTTGSISGVVTDENNDPLPGAELFVTGIDTDQDGTDEFDIERLGENSNGTLEFEVNRTTTGDSEVVTSTDLDSYEFGAFPTVTTTEPVDLRTAEASSTYTLASVPADDNGVDLTIAGVAGGVTGTSVPGTVTTDATGSANVQIDTTLTANFEVSNVAPDGATVDAGDDVTVTAEIENTGTGDGTQDIEFRLDTSGDGTLDSSETLATNSSFSVDAGETRTVTFAGVSTDGLSNGTYTHGVFSEDDDATATITVEDGDNEVGNGALRVDFDPGQVTANEETDVTVTVTNQTSGDVVEGANVDITDLGLSGTTDANGQVTLSVNATGGTYPVEVSADGFTTVSPDLTVEEDAPAYYTLTLSNSTADRGVQTATISTFSTYRQSGSTALLPRSVYRYTRTHTGGQR